MTRETLAEALSDDVLNRVENSGMLPVMRCIILDALWPRIEALVKERDEARRCQRQAEDRQLERGAKLSELTAERETLRTWLEKLEPKGTDDWRDGYERLRGAVLAKLTPSPSGGPTP